MRGSLRAFIMSSCRAFLIFIFSCIEALGYNWKQDKLSAGISAE